MIIQVSPSSIITSLRESSFSVSDVTDEHNIYLGLFTKLLFARLIAIYSFLMVHSMFLPTYNISCNYCCVTFSPTCVTPRFHVAHVPKANLVYIYMLRYNPAPQTPDSMRSILHVSTQLSRVWSCYNERDFKLKLNKLFTIPASDWFTAYGGMNL